MLLRPSYVLGGRAMELVHDTDGLKRYMRTAVQVSGDHPVLVDHYLRDAIEVDVDALGDGETIHVAGIMEHIEEAGIHSGDSACSLPPYSLGPDVIAEIKRQTVALGRALNVIGLMNVQYAVKDGEVYLIEVNPRGSRTVPFVAKATGVPIAKIAARVMAGEKLSAFPLEMKPVGKHVAIKEAVFPFARFPGVDVVLGPEMKSTGEVMGLDRDFGRAFAKSQLAGGVKLPVAGQVFISVKDHDKNAIARVARDISPARLPHRRDPRHGGPSPGAGHRGADRQQGARRPAAYRRRDDQRRNSAGLQHDRGRPGHRRQLQPAAYRARASDPLLHHRGGGAGGRAGDLCAAKRLP